MDELSAPQARDRWKSSPFTREFPCGNDGFWLLPFPRLLALLAPAFSASSPGRHGMMAPRQVRMASTIYADRRSD